ncbi:MAG: general secretion pathway protein GspB [Desulfuromonadales bacterium]|nr:general secretion pathway protein GspB [Desulfuromonadales bacterium]
MSLILEALKKSEQQRQQQTGVTPTVRKRTLALTVEQRRRSLPLILAGALGLTLLAAGLLIGRPDTPAVEQAVVANRPEVPQPVAPRELTPEPASVSAVEPPVTEAAPVPQPLGGMPAEGEPTEPAQRLARPTATPATIALASDLPLYQNLSSELRSRMPRLEMSMHFHAASPQRRLVRINNQLAREGDWLTDDLQLVEITVDGAILDYLGTLFEFRTGP